MDPIKMYIAMMFLVMLGSHLADAVDYFRGGRVGGMAWGTVAVVLMLGLPLVMIPAAFALVGLVHLMSR